MKTFIALIAFAALAGCVSEDAMTSGSRVLAKQAVNSVIAEKAPGLNAAPVTDCIIDNANASELTSLAAGVITGGATSQTTDLVMTIAGRKDTQSCIVSNLGSSLISGGGLAILQGSLL